MMYMPNRNMELFGDPPSLDEPSDNDLGIIDRLEKFSQIEIPSYRQQACIDIDEALNYCHTKDDFDRVKRIALELVADQDLNVRVSLLDQLQCIGLRCITSTNCRDSLFQFITSSLINSLKDHNHQVRKSAQTSLIILTNRGFYSKHDLERLYVDTIQDMLLPDTNAHELNDFPPEAITLISALAMHLGGDVIVHKFLDRYIELCGDMLLHVRKCCASSFPKMCQVSDVKVVEQKLLPIFSQLCNDDIWGVRKACAEGFTAISNSIEQRARVQVLTPLFLHLLNDTSRYVKLAAYQQLGPFITTFQNRDREVTETVKKEYKEPRERSPTNPEYDDFLFWKPAVHINTDELERELYGEAQKTTSENPANTDSNTSTPTAETDSNINTPTAETDSNTSTPTAETDSNTNTPTADNTSLGSTTDTPSNETCESGDAMQTSEGAVEAEIREAVGAVEGEVQPGAVGGAIGGTAVEKITSNLEEKMSDKTNKEDFKAMFQRDEDDDDDEAMQIDERGMQLRNFFQTLLDKGKDGREGGREDEEVFDSNLSSVNKSPDWGLATQEQMNKFHKDPLTPKIIRFDSFNSIKLSDSGTDQEKLSKLADTEEGVLVGTIDITKPVFGVLDKEDDNEMAYSFTQKDEDLELASDSSDMDIDAITSPSLSSVSSPVPGALIDCYTNMANNLDEDNPRADDDILTHCAYAFPGVVHTLGRDSWSLLRGTYLTLAENLPHSMSNVRQTLACSLHEIAHVIGPELTQQDLIHPFNSFIYDIDSVKIGLLKNLSKFLQHVSVRHRQELLHQMKEIQKCEDRKNWRYRQTFAQQLPHLCVLYTTQEVFEHIQPIVINLTMDQVAQVRQASFVALSKLLYRFKSENEVEFYNSTSSNVKSKFASSSKCSYRQSYVLICMALIRDQHFDIIDSTFLGRLLDMVTDRTPNVRLWVGQCLLLLQNNLKNDELSRCLWKLQADSDHDVRHFSTHITSLPSPCT